MEKSKIIINGNTCLLSTFNKEYDRMLYCYFVDNILVGINFMQGFEPNDKISISDIVTSECTMLWNQIKDEREEFVSNINNIEQALHLCLHISEIYCNLYIYVFLK
jgi:hypothetical protein